MIELFSEVLYQGNELPSSQFHCIYGKAPPPQNGPLRRLIVDMWGDRKIENEERYPREMLVELVNGLTESTQKGQNDSRATRLADCYGAFGKEVLC
jgi:hypothetical protein